MPLRRARILLLAVLALVTSVLLPAAPVAAGAGIAPSDPPQRTITFQIRGPVDFPSTATATASTTSWA